MTYAIHRYPAGLIDVVRLDGGTRVTIRPILPQDAEIEQAFVRNLSPGSRHSRFFSTIRELPPSLLKRFTEVDYRSHLALIAEVFDGDSEVIIGDARYVVEEDASSAEFAVAVADAWRGKGIGGLLLARLECHAAAAGVAHLTADTLYDNQPMLHLARQAGFIIDPEPKPGGLVRLSKEIGPAARSVPCFERVPHGLIAAA